MLGPIERPQSVSNIPLNKSQQSILNNYQNDLINQLTMSSLLSNQNAFQQNVNNYSEFKLFGEEVKNSNLESLNLTPPAQPVWPLTSNSHSILNKRPSNQAWNSVLLNDFDSYAPESPLLDLIDSSVVDSSGNTIKSIWSNNNLDDEIQK